MESLLPESIKQSKGMKVIIGTSMPLSIQGILRHVRQHSTGDLTLGILKPEAVCDRFTVKLGEMLYIRSADISSFGTLSTAPSYYEASASDEDEDDSKHIIDSDEDYIMTSDEDGTNTVETADK